jgi:hypothetical protein
MEVDRGVWSGVLKGREKCCNSRGEQRRDQNP